VYTSAESTPLAPPLDPIASLRDALRGHYEIERELGQGAFATVYLARDLKHERKVAIKVLHVDPNSEMGELRFVREIRMLARLQHPNILPLHDSGHVENLLYYVMPYVSGETLRDRLRAERQLPWETACNITREVADALTYAHAQGIIHRDIKPENILLSAGHPMLADFGIARAIDVAGVKQLTRTGMGSPGTPAYMSPEQLLGIGEVDARSDVYSLGCVLFEMLTGRLPFPGDEGLVNRFTDPAPTPTSICDGLPAWIDSVTERALARSPSERFQTAQDLVDAIPAAQPTVSGWRTVSRTARGAVRDRSAAKLREWMRTHLLLAVALAVVVAAILGVSAFSAWSSVRGGVVSRPDSARIAVFPMLTESAPDNGLAARVTDRLYEAFGHWDDLTLVSDAQVSDAVSQAGHAPRTLADAAKVARDLGAGSFVWGRVVHAGDVPRARVELYNLRSPTTSVREVFLDGDTPESYLRASAALLIRSEVPTRAIGAEHSTRIFAALTAYDRGHARLADWQLLPAESAFAEAVKLDPQFPQARLWLGQLREWRSPTNQQLWREHADRATAGSATLNDRERLQSAALSAIAAKNYDAACSSYGHLAQIDSADFIGWYGLGDCQALDGTVLPDAKSPSGYRWRSSYESAVSSFLRALRVEPGAHTLLSFARLRRMLPTTAVNLRTDNPESPQFAAVPSLSADTLAFVPYPITVFRQGLPASATASLNRALSRNLSLLFGIVNDWLAATPNNADAYESLADLLETRGDISERGAATESATGATRKAVSLSADPAQRMRLFVRLARLQFKRGEYSSVRTSADSLIKANPRGDLNDSPVLISLSALAGKTQATSREAARYIIPANAEGIALGTGLRDAAARLFTYAALGVCGDSLASAQRQLDEQLTTSVADEQRSKIRAVLLSRSLPMMVACGVAPDTRASPQAGNLARLQQAFARQDRREIDRVFASIARVRRVYRPGDVSLERTYEEAWIKAAIGDTTAAERQLDQSLNAIPSMSASALLEVGSAAAAGRAMALRADIAAARGSPLVAKKWATAVVQLWGGADAPLRPVVLRMQQLSSAH
jgi:tRNA A-37 threonylcarbamoyl transferase component Bud32/tetratricopeptide (TPR) repeat protein